MDNEPPNVEIIKDPAYDVVQKAAANESLAKQFDLLAVKALKSKEIIKFW